MHHTNKLILALISAMLFACSSGTSQSNLPANTVSVPTFNYQPGNKTAVMASIGGGAQIVAEIDTGSELTVVDESAVGSNIQKTSQIIPITYGAGTNTVSGYLAYGTIQFTTTTGATLSTSPSTPILVVTQGSVNQGGGNNAVMGMRMNNQVSSRLFLPYPYNQMMILNRSESRITFGNLTSTQLRQFATINQTSVACQNYAVPQTAANTCWNTQESSVTYTYSLTGGGFGSTDYTTIFDSGEPIGNFYLSTIPSWMNLGSMNIITNQLSATINTSHGPLPLPMSSPLRYTPPLTPPGAVNPGNLFFNTYQVLFDQADGKMGFLNYNESW